MTDTSWQPTLSGQQGPQYLAVSRALLEAVRRGDLREGAQLPPVRDLAWRLGVTPGTVARAYQIGTQDGLLEAVVGRGTFVAGRVPQLGPTQALLVEPETATHLDLRAPHLPDVGQAAAIAEAMRAASAKIGAGYLDYPTLSSDRDLRARMVDWLGGDRLGALGPDDIVLTQGGQNAIVLILQCCLRGDRPVVFAEELAYAGFRHGARLCRAEIVPVALDAEGMVPEALDLACRRHPGRVVCLTPQAQNPTAARMSAERRVAILRVARAHDLQVIEDDCYAVGGDSLPSLRLMAPDRVWHISSLSKTVAAGLRFGILACPTGRGQAARVAAQHGSFGMSRVLVDTITELVGSGAAARIRDAVQTGFATRLGAALNRLGHHDVSWQPGLPFLWLRLPSGWRASTFARAAEARGVLVRSSDVFALVDSTAPNAVRLPLSGNEPEARFTAGIDALADLLDNPPRDMAV